MVLDKTADEMITFMRTGNFPEKSVENNTYNTSNVAPRPIPNGYEVPYTEHGGPAPMDSGSLQRPQRYY